MLRNLPKCRNILRFLVFQQNTQLRSKNTNTFRQAKIMGKLFGHRVSGSKKQYFPSNTNSTQSPNASSLFKQSQQSGGGKNANRRVTVLNKLFMKHITDLLATGEISEFILGKGLQISRLKTTADFGYINVFWFADGDLDKDNMLEQELQRCSGLLRHELSQLFLMGVVPRIKFVKDKHFTNLKEMQTLIKDMDLGNNDEEQQEEIDFRSQFMAETLKREFFDGKRTDISEIKQQTSEENSNESLETIDFVAPKMRHDVLGLDHKNIMLKIYAKMRKSKLAWDQHLQRTSLKNLNSEENTSSIYSTSQLANEKLPAINENTEKFDAFLVKRNEKRNAPERKKLRASDHNLNYVKEVNDDNGESLMSEIQREIYEAEDYLPEDAEDNYKYK